jgi:recombination protein RecT
MTTAGTTALAERIQDRKLEQASAKPGSDVLGWLRADSTKGELAKALPRHMDPAHFARIVLTEVRRNPQLLSATRDSFVLAVLNAAQLGLEPGPLGHAYLVPYRNSRTNTKEVQLLLGYKGLQDLAHRSGTVDVIDAVAVHEGEPFKISRGSESKLEHEELASCADNAVIAYYAVAYPTNGGRPVFEVMWPKDIEAIRKRSQAKDDGPWKTDYDAMALKTVVRRLLNRGKVRLSSEIASAIQEDEARELGYAAGPVDPASDEAILQAAAAADAKTEAAGSESSASAEAANTEPTAAEPPHDDTSPLVGDPGAAFRKAGEQLKK